MAIRVVPHSPELTEAVLAFNERMRVGGSPWGFYPDPVPDWVPPHQGAKTWREYHLAVDDTGEVRAGYALKPQLWEIRGAQAWVTDWQGPFTEAAINPRYSALGLRLIREMLKCHPLLFSLGHGGDDEPIVRLLRGLGWTLHGTPFCLRILHPTRFLRLNRYLRASPWRRVALDVLAWTGVGEVGVRVLQRLKSPSRGRISRGVSTKVVSEFGAWADELWERAHGSYLCLAVRDRTMMNALMPRHGWPGGVRLRVDLNGSPIGWAVVHAKQMLDDHRFGNLNVGLVTDSFALPEHADRVVSAAHDFLADAAVDLICSNQTHPAWVRAFRRNGYLVLRNRRLFAISPALKDQLEPFSETVTGLHLTNMDGHGPHGFNTNTGETEDGYPID